jgi:hypothetical protein
MADERDETNASTWQPATSEPGEIYTVEGQIRGIGAFASGLKSRSRGSREYRSSMVRVGATIIGIGVLLAVVFALIF